MHKRHELEAAKAKIAELEQKVSKKDQDLAEMKRMMNRIKEENVENIQTVEEANATLMEAQTQMGLEIMQLQDALARSNRAMDKPDVRGVAGSATSSSTGSLAYAGVVGVPIVGGGEMRRSRHAKSSSTLGSDDK